MTTRGAEVSQVDKSLCKRNNLKTDSFSIVINRRTKVENLDECTFQYKEPEQISPMKIIDIKDVPGFDTITTVEKVHVPS